jgi:hypothetical protein
MSTADGAHDGASDTRTHSQFLFFSSVLIMFACQRTLSCALAIILLSVIAPASSTQLASRKWGTPTTLELDLVFPGNETYKPLAYFPVAFLLQYALYAEEFDMFLRWNLSRDGQQVEHDIENIAPPGDRNYVLRPAILVNGTRQVYTVTAHWRLDWIFGFQHNCSCPSGSNRTICDNAGGSGEDSFTTNVSAWPEPGTFNLTGSMEFSTAMDAPVPTFQNNSACSTFEGIFSIDQSLNWSNTNANAACPVIAPAPQAWENPCEVKRSHAGDQVTSVMNALASCTDTEVYWPAITTPCTPQATSAAAAAGRLPILAAMPDAIYVIITRLRLRLTDFSLSIAYERQSEKLMA